MHLRGRQPTRRARRPLQWAQPSPMVTTVPDLSITDSMRNRTLVGALCQRFDPGAPICGDGALAIPSRIRGKRRAPQEQQHFCRCGTVAAVPSLSSPKPPLPRLILRPVFSESPRAFLIPLWRAALSIFRRSNVPFFSRHTRAALSARTTASNKRERGPRPACAGQRTGSAYYCYYQTHLSCELRGLFSLHLGPRNGVSPDCVSAASRCLARPSGCGGGIMRAAKKAAASDGFQTSTRRQKLCIDTGLLLSGTRCSVHVWQ